MERLACDPRKISSHLDDWRSGAQLPGRTMAFLKTAGLPDWLASLDSEAAASMLAAWAPWEKAKAAPGDVLAALVECGIDDLLAHAAV